MRTVVILVAIVLLAGCEFQQEADRMFGDQHFKTAIALVELHKTRYGEYPESLDDLTFVGSWDENALARVRYGKVGDGYTLVLAGNAGGASELEYPPAFWRGLGIRNGEEYGKPSTL